MKDPAQLATLVIGLAFALAFVFGAVAHRVSFCTMGAITDIVNFGDWRRMRMWLLAIAVAIAGAAALQAAGLVDFAKTIYTGSKVPWLSHLVGGFLFGFGMTLASGCGSKTLIRVGAGNLKSLVVLVFLAVAAYMTLKGAVRAVARERARPDPRRRRRAATSDLPALAASLRARRREAVAAVRRRVRGRRASCFANRDFRTTRELIVGGLVVGAVIVGGWYVSGHLGYLAEDPATLEEKFVATNSGRMESYSFVAPVAYLLELLVLWTDQSRVLTFGIAGVLGMIAGSRGDGARHADVPLGGLRRRSRTSRTTSSARSSWASAASPRWAARSARDLRHFDARARLDPDVSAAIIVGSVAAVKYQMWRSSGWADRPAVNRPSRPDVLPP